MRIINVIQHIHGIEHITDKLETKLLEFTYEFIEFFPFEFIEFLWILGAVMEILNDIGLDASLHDTVELNWQ
jgi:uncharacterized membrane protein YphA (DoxX/SURF4 family)